MRRLRYIVSHESEGRLACFRDQLIALAFARTVGNCIVIDREGYLCLEVTR